MRSAYLLVSHGSSDPRHQAGLSRLATTMRQHLERSLREEFQMASGEVLGPAPSLSRSLSPLPPASGPTSRIYPLPLHGVPRIVMPPAPVVGTATLEASVVPLAQQIETFARRVVAQGVRQVVIVPLFLLAGVHVKEDLPREIAAAQARLPARLQVVCAPYLGSDAAFKRFVAARLSLTQADRCLLVAHGSRRPAGNRSVKQLAAILDADIAFWSVPPDLETQVMELIQQGHQRIAIAPYFLFPGGITDAITRRTEALAERLPKLWIRLLAPLGTSAELGKVVAELALSLPHDRPRAHWETERVPMTGSGITA